MLGVLVEVAEATLEFIVVMVEELTPPTLFTTGRSAVPPKSFVNFKIPFVSADASDDPGPVQFRATPCPGEVVRWGRRDGRVRAPTVAAPRPPVAVRPRALCGRVGPAAVLRLRAAAAAGRPHRGAVPPGLRWRQAAGADRGPAAPRTSEPCAFLDCAPAALDGISRCSSP